MGLAFPAQNLPMLQSGAGLTEIGPWPYDLASGAIRWSLGAEV